MFSVDTNCTHIRHRTQYLTSVAPKNVFELYVQSLAIALHVFFYFG